MTGKSKAALLIALCLLGLAALFAIRLFLLNEVVNSAFAGDQSNFITRTIHQLQIANPKFRTVDYFIGRGCATLAGIGILLILVTLLGIARIYRDESSAWLRRFFLEPVSPTNLAMFRIFLFAAIIYKLCADHAVLFGDLPREYIHPTFGLSGLVRYIPISASLVNYAWWACIIFAASGLIGFFSRTSALLTTLTGIYVLGVPQLFGKVNHDVHHLMWFIALMSFSPCGDVLAIDAIRNAFKRADAGTLHPPAPTAAYGFPLKIVWILIGILYFYPGFWKLFYGGYDWIFSDNLKNYLYMTGLGDPSNSYNIRIDKIPGLITLMAIATIAFEMLFIVLIFSRLLRPIIAAIAFSFHVGTLVLMRVHFYSLQMCYASLVPFDRFFRWIGRKLFSQTSYVLYDGNCKLCRRTIASLQTIDIFKSIRYVSAMDDKTVDAIDGPVLSKEALMMDMHYVKGDQVWKGYESYRQISYRIPLLWPMIPFLYFPPIAAIGRAIYRKVADSRTCSIVDHQANTRTDLSHIPVRSISPLLVLLAIFLIISTNIMGMAGIVHSWPIASYPTFQTVAKPVKEQLSIVVVDPKGNETPLNTAALEYAYGGERLWPILGFSISDPQQADRRFNDLWNRFCTIDPTLASITHLRFYQQRQLVNPEDPKIIESKLVYEWVKK